MANTAVPLLTVWVPSMAMPSMNVTVPSFGVVVLETVAVNVIVCPYVGDVCDTLTDSDTAACTANVVGSVKVLNPEFAVPPPETVPVFEKLAGALSAMLTVMGNSG